MSAFNPRPEAQIEGTKTKNFLDEQKVIESHKQALKEYGLKASKNKLQGDESWWDWYLELKNLYSLALRSTTYASAYAYNTEAQKLIGAITRAPKESVGDQKRTEIQNLMHTYVRIER